MRVVRASSRAAVERLLEPGSSSDRTLERRVSAIVDRVRTRGDTALRAYARRFDGFEGGALELTSREIRAGAAKAPRDVRAAIAAAAAHVRRVARRQVPASWTVTVVTGVTVEQRVMPLGRVACYVPGGRYALPSSLLMTAVPAHVAGVRDVVVACPRPSPAVLAAAVEAGVSSVFRLGGAHAVAAFAYGTRSVPRADKIVGPGNRYVAAAKAHVAADCAIDFVAGPSEVVILASRGRADWIAADLIAQAEHDPDARAILITWSDRLARRVAAEIRRQLRPEDRVARAALARRGGIIVARDETEAVALAERAAAEHLVCQSERLARRVRAAGTICVGLATPVAAGDYATGSNHVLPTGGLARGRGGLSAADFVRVSSVQRVSRAGLARLAPTILTLAGAEGLAAHARSIEVRLS